MRRIAVAACVALALGNLTCARRESRLAPSLATALHRLSIEGTGEESALAWQPATRSYGFRAAAYVARLDGEVAAVEMDAPAGAARVALRPVAAPLALQGASDERGALIYAAGDGDAAIVLRPGTNGIKEDIVLTRARGDRLAFAWEIDLAPGGSARLDGNGDVLVARSDGKRAFRIPAPVVRQASGAPAPDAARFELHGRRLTLRASGLAALDYPITIDPTILVDGAAGLRTGNDEGGATYGNDRLLRQRTAVGLGDWAPTSAVPGGRSLASGVAYNGRLYVVGGNSGQTAIADVQMAPIAADGSLGAWISLAPLPAPRFGHVAVAYDGYLYVAGGSDGSHALSDVQVAPIAADGSLGTWSLAGSFAGARSAHAALAYNGNLYVVGGASDDGTQLGDVQMAALHGDGTLGTWATTGALPSARSRHAAVAWGDDLYLTGGWDGKTLLADAWKAPLSPTGAVGVFVRTTNLPSPRADHAAVAHGGYLYLAGGCAGGSPCTMPLADVVAGSLSPTGSIDSWADVSSLAKPSSNLVAVAYDNHLYVLGGSGANGGVLDDTQVAPLLAGGSLAAWTSLGAMGSRFHHALVAYHGFLYSIGGCNGTLTFGACFPVAGHMLDEVLVAPIHSDGTLGAWTASTPLPSARWGHAAVAANGYLVVTGGCGDDACTNKNLADVLTAPVDPITGAVGAWRLLNTPLLSPRWGHASTANNDHIYVTGGCTNSDSQPVCIAMLNDVLVALLNPDGTITPWSPSPNTLPSPRFGHTSTAYNGRIYTVGGYEPTDYLAQALVAPLAQNGGVGAWTPTTPLPVARAHHATVAYNGNLYLVGGCNGSDPSIACDNFFVDALVAPLLSDGKLGAWAGGPLLTPGRARHGVAAYNGFLYSVGGCEGIGCDPWVPDVSVSAINSAPGAVGAWTPLNMLPKSRWGHTAIAAAGHLYVLGGLTNLNPSPDVTVAALTDGTIGAWKLTTPFPLALWGQCTVSAKGYVYSFGGDTAPVDHDLVNLAQRAPIQPTGDLGAWEMLSPIPSVNVFHACVAVNDRIYIVGGYDKVHTLPNVWVTTLDDQGMPGAWSSATSMPTGRVSHAMTYYGGWLYVAGGSDDTGFLRDDVISAPVLADGSLGTWGQATHFPIARYSPALAAADGYLYLIGGNIDIQGGNTPTNDILWAPILAHGSIGDWSTAGSYLARVNESVTLANGYLFTVGGSDPMADELADVLVAPLLPPAATGGYSRLIDIGYEAASLDTLTVAGTASLLGKARLRYRTAPAGGVFGSTVDKGVVPFGQTLALGDTNVRYLWLGLTLDDQAAATLEPDEAGERDITAVHLGYTDRCATVSCVALDECHAAGDCAPSTGICTNPTLADGTDCSAGLCEAGSCIARRGISGFGCSVGRAPSRGALLGFFLLLMLIATRAQRRET